MKIKNLFYGIVGYVAYAKCFIENKVDIKTTDGRKIDAVSVDGKEIGIYHIPDINKYGILYCAIIVDQRNFKAFIAVDDMFLRFSEELQQAMIYHEIGHYVLGHFNKGAKYMWDLCVQLGKIVLKEKGVNVLHVITFLTRKVEDEFEADEYAMSKVGIDALKRMLHLIHEVILSAGCETTEYIDRYNNLNLKEVI